jgi:holo-[acyl-carrier protein] synthase
MERIKGIMNTSPYRVGIDIVEVQHIQDSIERFGQRFLDKIFTTDEQAYCNSYTHISAAAQSFAARFAAKEAVLKVLRPAGVGLDWRTIEVRRMPAGYCDIQLHQDAAELAKKRGIRALSVSMSHELAYATAIVIADF